MTVSLVADEVRLAGRNFNKVVLGASRTSGQWVANLATREINGHLSWTGQTIAGGKLTARLGRRALHGAPCILEGFVPFEREISVVVARARDGSLQSFDVTENEHRDHILKVSRVPAAIPAPVAGEATRIAESIATAFDYIRQGPHATRDHADLTLP